MANRWQVFLGAVSQHSAKGQQVGVTSIVYHSGYLPFLDPNSEENSNDIALMHLAAPLSFTGEHMGVRAKRVPGSVGMSRHEIIHYGPFHMRQVFHHFKRSCHC